MFIIKENINNNKKYFFFLFWQPHTSVSLARRLYEKSGHSGLTQQQQKSFIFPLPFKYILLLLCFITRFVNY